MVPQFHPYLQNERDMKLVKLEKEWLWQQFSDKGNEMIITKGGRKMFPVVEIQLQELEPTARYDVWLSIELAAGHRFKYQAQGGWKEAGSADANVQNMHYIHERSGQSGAELQAKTIQFDKVRLTNSPEARTSRNSGLLCLNSMHQYVVVVTLAKHTPFGSETRRMLLPITKFVAVTAYQNPDVIALKIVHNPFAKAFRQDGQARCRKRTARQSEILEEVAKRPKRPETSVSDCSLIESDASSTSDHEIDIMTPEPAQIISEPVQKYNIPQYSFIPSLGLYNYYPVYFNEMSCYPGFSFRPSYFPIPVHQIEHQEAKTIPEKRKITDFTIDSILA